MKTYTIDDILARRPCAIWPEVRIKRVFKRWGRSTFTLRNLVDALEAAGDGDHRATGAGLLWLLRELWPASERPESLYDACTCGCSRGENYVKVARFAREALAL